VSDGVVESVHRRAERFDPPESLDAVAVSVDGGLEGDYHHDLTLIAAEAVEELARDTGIELGPGESHRNVTTRGIDLNALVGRRFGVGAVEAVGVELAEPCTRLVKLTGSKGVLRGLVHRGGLRADVLVGGTIAVGDPVRDIGAAPSRAAASRPGSPDDPR
jgi:MOSC domain-containing protein YiiM